MPALWRRLKPYALLTILALPGLWPSALAGIPRTNDNLDHFFRTVELDQLVRAGIFFPRWAPHLVLGFGYPIFDFFPYEAHYLVEALHILGLNFLTAYNLAGALALLASGWFAFRLGREHFGLAAGLVAGVAYLYSSYVLYDNYVRGSLPESLALALLPLALLYLRRAVRGDRPAAAWAGLALAAAIFAHQGVMLQAMPFVGGYAAWEMVLGNWKLVIGNWRLVMGSWRLVISKWKLLITNYQLLFVAFVLALALSCFFWLPALAEARFVQTERGTHNGPMNYANNFLGLDQLFALPRLPVDPDLLNPPVVHSLPMAALVLAGLAVARWVWPRIRPQNATEQGWSLVYFGAASLAAALLMHPLAKPLWDALPLLQLTLFPWRLLGPISLFVALAAGALFVDREPSPASFIPGGFVLLPLALVFLIAAGLPFATPPRETVTPNPSLADLAAFEVPPDFIGTTTVGEYLPAWVRQLPDLAADREQLARGASVARYLAPGAEVQPGPARPLGATYTVQAQQAVSFVFRTFYFPGWRATLDGQPAPIAITAPEGLMAVAVPAGTHRLDFEFGSTLPRTVGDTLSVIGLVAVAGWLLWPRTSPPTPPPEPLREEHSGDGPLSGYFGLALLLAAARPLLYDAGLTPLLRRGLAAQPPAVASQPLDLSFSGELHLLGADLPAQVVAADDPLIITLYWQAEHRLGVDYGFDVHLVDTAGHSWTVPGYSRPADWRFTPGTDFWPAGQYIVDPYVLTWLPGTPPGRYTAVVTVFARYNQQSIGTKPAGLVTVGSPSRKRTCSDSVGTAIAPGVKLQQIAIEPASAAPGDDVTVSLCWMATAGPSADLQGQLLLADSYGMLLAARSFTLGGDYPASRWAAGDVLRDQVTVRLPAKLATGQYTWSARVAEGSAVPLGVESVTAPARTFRSPPVETRLDADLGPITLWGVSELPPELAPGANLKLVLAWLDNATPYQSYNVFVHLETTDGTLVAQSDGVPADWTRRTTGWLPGEYVADARSMHLPPDLAPGEYSLFAGLYRPDTGERLTTAVFPDGQVPIGKIVIGK